MLGPTASREQGWWEVSSLMGTIHNTTGYPKVDYWIQLSAPYSSTQNFNRTHQPLPQHFLSPFSTLGTSSGAVSLCSSNSSSADTYNPHNSLTAFCSVLPHAFTAPHFLYHKAFFFSFSSKACSVQIAIINILFEEKASQQYLEHHMKQWLVMGKKNIILIVLHVLLSMHCLSSIALVWIKRKGKTRITQ